MDVRNSQQHGHGPFDGGAGLRRALATLRGDHLRAVAWARVAANGVVAVGYGWALLLGGAAGWAGPAAFARLALLLGAAVVLAYTRWGDRPAPSALAALGVAVDVASLAVGGWRATGVLGRGGALLAVAEVAVLAAVLALAVAQASAARSVEDHGARADEDVRRRTAEVEGQLDRSRRDLLGAQARTEGFVQLVVHDLRNPLAVVLANARLALDALEADPQRAEQVDLLKVATAEAVRLSRMIGDLLLVPRLEGGEVAGRFAATSVRDVLDDVAIAISVRARAKEIRVEVRAPPELVAWLDGGLVRRMVENLVANGLRHTPRGGRIELAALVERDRLRLAVRNTGEPIPDSVRARLFEKYATQGKADDAARSGLGLYLCRLVAEAHGGRIELVEREGWSVSFEATLPLAPTRAEGAQGAEAGARNGDGGGAVEALGTKRGGRSESNEGENAHA